MDFVTKQYVWIKSRLCRRELLVHLRFSLQWMKIINWNSLYDYISMSYRPSLSFVTLDQLLIELFPLITFSFPDLFLPWMKWEIFIWLHISISSFGTFDLLDWITCMALDKLRHAVVGLITRKLFRLELSNLVFWCILRYSIYNERKIINI
jgi:hypothetical protein